MFGVTEVLPAVRVLGIGSPFGLDRIGWDVITALQQSEKLQIYLDQQLMLESLDRPGVNLLRYFESAEYVFIIDAVIDDNLAIGEVKKYSIEEINSAELLQSAHSFGVKEALALAQVLDQLPQKIKILGVSVGSQTNKNIDWDGTISALTACLESEIVRICDVLVKKTVTY